jgi:hypothetical protein
MKRLRFTLVLAVAVGRAIQTSAAVYSFNYTSGFASAGVIPDGNATGWFDTRTLSGIGDASITDVDVSLTISGGYAGDFYAYLVHFSGFSVLLNRVGRTGGNPFGYGNNGLNITLDDSAANGDIHMYQVVPGYAPMIGNGSGWSPDGRNTSPLFALNTDSQSRMLNQLNGLDPNGTWTLFIADLSGGAQGSLVSWGLNITAVPEPSSLGLITLGAWAVVRRKFRGRNA